MKGKVDGWWKKIFKGIFRSMLHWWFFAFYSGHCDWIGLILDGLKDLFTLLKFWQSFHWPLKLMMPQAVEGIWICTGGSGEWVIESLVPQQSHKSLSLMQQVSFSPALQSENIPGHKVSVNCAMYNLSVYQILNYAWTQSPTLRLKG